MSDERVILDPGYEGDADGVGWRPEVSLDHDATRSELYVIVGEEVGSMTEGVSTANFEEIRRRLNLLSSVESLRAGIREARRLLYQTRPAPLGAARVLGAALGVDEGHTQHGPCTDPDGHLWVMGDERCQAEGCTAIFRVPEPGGIAGGVLDGSYDPGGPPGPN